MISVEDARAAVLEGVRALPDEQVALPDALGRVLADDVTADMDVAPFDNSAMDGYAVIAADLEGATPETPVVLRVLDHITAGAVSTRTIERGTASRIMTGAPLPPGADAVVRIEVTRGLEADGGAGGTVAIESDARSGDHVRPRGSEWRTGDLVLPAGDRIGPAAVGLLAATGHATVRVHRRPRVAVITTGDELVDVTEKPGPGKIRNSNLYTLGAQVTAAGGVPVLIGVVEDTEDAVRAALIDAAAAADVVVSSGGVSVGDRDYVLPILREIGSVRFDSVALRPGSSQTFGHIGDTPFFGLPGNPTATYIGFEILVRPMLRVMQGLTSVDRHVVKAALVEGQRKKPSRRQYIRVTLRPLDPPWPDGVRYEALLAGNQSSAMLTAMHRAECLAVLPYEGGEFPAGTVVDCMRLDVEESVSL